MNEVPLWWQEVLFGHRPMLPEHLGLADVGMPLEAVEPSFSPWKTRTHRTTFITTFKRLLPEFLTVPTPFRRRI